MKIGTFKLTFLSIDKGNRSAVITALRILAPTLGRIEARDLTFSTGPRLVTLGYAGQKPRDYYDAMDALAKNGVYIDVADALHVPDVDSDTIETACTTPEPESSKGVSACTSISADIRVIVLGALKRKEYETATALIEVLKDLDNS